MIVQCDCLNDNFVAILDLKTGQEIRRIDRKGEVATWSTSLVLDKLLYTCNDNGQLAVRDAMTGQLIYRERIGAGGGTYSASAVAAGGHLYFVSELGEVTVIAQGKAYKQAEFKGNVVAVETAPFWDHAIAAAQPKQGEYNNIVGTAPRAVISDGAVVLREPVETLGIPRKRPISLRDMKHFLANQWENSLAKDPAYQEFSAHFIPQPMTVKKRFMNLALTLRWTPAVLWHLAHPESRSRREITAARMNDKFGWLRTSEPAIRS